MQSVEPGTKVMRSDGDRSAWYRVVGVGRFEICTKASKEARVKRRIVHDEDKAVQAVDSFLES
jgi:hypothetical protein